MLKDYLSVEDKVKILKILESSGYFYPNEIKTGMEVVDEYLKKGKESGYNFISVFEENSDDMLGFICFGKTPCTDNRYDIYWIAVDNKKRRHGLGKILINSAEKAIQEVDGKLIFAETSSRSKYLDTRNFYDRCGFSLHAVIKDFYSEGDSKVVYSKKI